MCVACCVLCFVLYCCLFIVCCSGFGVVYCVLFNMCCLLLVVYHWFFLLGSLSLFVLIDARCLLFVVNCVLLDVVCCCLLLFVMY